MKFHIFMRLCWTVRKVSSTVRRDHMKAFQASSRLTVFNETPDLVNTQPHKTGGKSKYQHTAHLDYFEKHKERGKLITDRILVY